MNATMPYAVLIAICAVLAGAPVDAQVHDTVTSSCTADSSAAVADAMAALKTAPENLANRFQLADALLEASCYDAAVHVLEEGEQTNPRNSELQKRLRTTRSLQTEQTYFEGLERAEIAARAQRNQLRCTRLGDVAACDEALKLQPDDTTTLIAKADALLKSDPAEALVAYRRAVELGADAGAIEAKRNAATLAVASKTPKVQAAVPVVRQVAESKAKPERVASVAPPGVGKAQAVAPAKLVAIEPPREYSNAEAASRAH